MATFSEAVVELQANAKTRTTNGMKTRVSSASACVDLFYDIGASRGKDILPKFITAYKQNPDLALRITQWARDVRGGSGERQVFRDILNYLTKTHFADAARLIAKVPELGRWDDLLVLEDKQAKELAFSMISSALKEGNALTAKWMPRKGKVAQELRVYLGMSPKQYRKTLVNLTKVVETQMCAKEWDQINFSHVPSLAHSRYRKAFNRNTEKYKEYVEALASGDPSVKINASAVFPYDILKETIAGGFFYNSNINTIEETERQSIIAQWDALPNYIGDAKVLPMVDTSGSMCCRAGGISSKSTLTCLQIAMSLGLYFASKNTGTFANTTLTFSGRPELQVLTGDIIDMAKQMYTGEVANTDLHGAFDELLKVAVKGKVPQEEMPQTLVILSDMQFDQGCEGYDESAIKMIKRKYKDAGYKVPNIVFWNLNSEYGNTPVKFDKNGTALISGFSPAIMGAVLSSDLKDFTPESIMLRTVMKERYNLA